MVLCLRIPRFLHNFSDAITGLNCFCSDIKPDLPLTSCTRDKSNRCPNRIIGLQEISSSTKKTIGSHCILFSLYCLVFVSNGVQTSLCHVFMQLTAIEENNQGQEALCLVMISFPPLSHLQEGSQLIQLSQKRFSLNLETLFYILTSSFMAKELLVLYAWSSLISLTWILYSTVFRRRV